MKVKISLKFFHICLSWEFLILRKVVIIIISLFYKNLCLCDSIEMKGSVYGVSIAYISCESSRRCLKAEFVFLSFNTSWL